MSSKLEKKGKNGKKDKKKNKKKKKTKKQFMLPNYGLRLGDSRLEGLGVFSTKSYKKDAIVEICQYLKIFEGHLDDDCEVGDYTFGFDDESEVLMLGYGSMYNHHKNANLDYFYNEDLDLFEYVALRDIKQDEELFINYGDEYWAAREIVPKE